MKKNIPTLLIFMLLYINSLAQSNKIELETTAKGAVPFSINNIIRPVSFVGISYLKLLKSNLYGIGSIGGMSNLYNDDCNNCADHFEGTTSLQHLKTSIGLRYMFREGINYYRKTWKQRFDYYLEFNLLYEKIKTSGRYGGGFSGGLLKSNNDYKGIGGALKAGGIYKITQHLYLGLSTSFYVTKGNNTMYSYNYYLAPKSNTTKDAYITFPLEFRLGYQF